MSVSAAGGDRPVSDPEGGPSGQYIMCGVFNGFTPDLIIGL